MEETWFDLQLPLNTDLVAIIGNKGSGKSALADIVALVGCARNFSKFSFLTPSRFRGSKARLASQFTATLAWSDGTTSSMDLDKDPTASSVERVKYLPQSYLDDLCNEIGERGSNTFDSELRKIIYSHVPEEAQLGQSSMDKLLAFKVTEIDKARQALKQDVSKINVDILEAERRISTEFRNSLMEQLAAKKAELAALEASEPQAVEDPNASSDALEESKAAAAQIEALELETLIGELGTPLPIESLLRVQIDAAPADAILKETQGQIVEIDAKLHSESDGSFLHRKAEATTAITTAKSKLGEWERQFVRYKEDVATWERRKADVNGAPNKAGSIAYLATEIA